MRKTRALLAAALFILGAQAIASYSLSHETFLPSAPPLTTFPLQMENWAHVQDWSIEPEVLAALGPDDTLSRVFELPRGSARASLFISYYKTQLRAKNAHDPKVCLPGSGWNPRESSVRSFSLPDSGRSIPVNYYRISKGGEEAVVLYWFQTHKAVYTFEQQLRVHRMLDAVFDNRTDMALVRIIVPVGENGVAAADAYAFDFARLIYPRMLPYFPPKENAGS